MYSSFPKRDRIAIRISLASAWAFTALAGAGGVLLTPTTVQAEVGLHLPLISSLLVLIFSFTAMIGIMLNKYQLEWVSAWFASGGSLAYVLTVWYLVFTGSPTRLQQAASLTSLIAFYIYRIISCSAHARKQRKIHELVQTGEVGPIDA